MAMEHVKGNTDFFFFPFCFTDSTDKGLQSLGWGWGVEEGGGRRQGYSQQTRVYGLNIRRVHILQIWVISQDGVCRPHRHESIQHKQRSNTPLTGLQIAHIWSNNSIHQGSISSDPTGVTTFNLHRQGLDTGLQAFRQGFADPIHWGMQTRSLTKITSSVT